MTDDWHVGDLALCVDASGPVAGAPCNVLQEGAVYRVAGLGVFCGFALIITDDAAINDAFLAGAPGAFRFRKIRPRPDKIERCEPEFATLLKRFKQTVPA